MTHRNVPLCDSSWELPIGRVQCAGDGTELCPSCERRFCASCLTPSGPCDECLNSIAGDAALDVAFNMSPGVPRG